MRMVQITWCAWKIESSCQTPCCSSMSFLPFQSFVLRYASFFLWNQISLVGFCHLLCNSMPGPISVEKARWAAIRVSGYVPWEGQEWSFCSGLWCNECRSWRGVCAFFFVNRQRRSTLPLDFDDLDIMDSLHRQLKQLLVNSALPWIQTLSNNFKILVISGNQIQFQWNPWCTPYLSLCLFLILFGFSSL